MWRALGLLVVGDERAGRPASGGHVADSVTYTFSSYLHPFEGMSFSLFVKILQLLRALYLDRKRSVGVHRTTYEFVRQNMDCEYAKVIYWR